MPQTYEYNGFTLHIAIEDQLQRLTDRNHSGYVAVVRICESGTALPRFADLRLGAAAGRTFASQDEALSEGFHAAQRMVDDLLCCLFY